MEKIKVFIHIATIGNYQEIVKDFFEKIVESKLIDEAEEIIFSIVGDGILEIPENNKIKINRNTDLSIGEFYTLEKIKSFADSVNDNYKILYIHTKGVTAPNNKNIIDWRNYMSFFNIIKYKEAIHFLNTYDTCGVDLVNEPTTHYSGNFWWANTNFLKTLPKIEEISNPDSKKILTLRHNAEFWICMIKSKNKSLFQSNINVYERHLHKFPEINYIK